MTKELKVKTFHSGTLIVRAYHFCEQNLKKLMPKLQRQYNQIACIGFYLAYLL